MRGISSLCILFAHAQDLSPFAIPRGYLAVDVFLVVSGFVITTVYGPRMAKLRATGLMRLRLKRLYPLYLAGFLLGALVLIAQARAHHAPLPVATLGCGLFLLPTFIWPGYVFPANPPAWTLGCQLTVDWGYGLVACQRQRLALALILLAGSGAVLVHGVLAAGDDNLGAQWATLPYGMARTVFSFIIGALLAHAVRKRRPMRRRSVLSPLIIVALVLVFALPMVWNTTMDLVCIMVLFPALVLLGALVEPPLPAPLEFIGDRSYALYCTHFPLLIVGRAIIGRLDIGRAIAGPILLTVILMLAAGFHRWFELPIQNRLTRRSPAVASIARSAGDDRIAADVC